MSRTPPPTLEIRPCQLEDLPGVGALFSQLGYVVSSNEIAERMASLTADPRSKILVAIDENRLVAVATMFVVPVLHDMSPWCRLTAVVVDEAARGRGVGEALVTAAEETAREAGCARIEATSARHRTGAHRFYERLGYRGVAKHFLKHLRGEGHEP